jgi:hypothetical protein
MQGLMIWLNYHRIGVVVVFGVCFWVIPYLWYFKQPFRMWLRRGKRHNWSVDMAGKKALFNGKEEIR